MTTKVASMAAPHHTQALAMGRPSSKSPRQHGPGLLKEPDWDYPVYAVTSQSAGSHAVLTTSCCRHPTA
jgi:hypothetical protein